MKQTVFRVLVLFSLVASVLFASFPMQTAQARAECTLTTSGRLTGFCVRILDIYKSTDGRLIVSFQGGQSFDFYQIRWSYPGIGESQKRVGGRLTWSALPLKLNKRYTIKLQGCTSGLFGSKCTAWDVQTKLVR